MNSTRQQKESVINIISIDTSLKGDIISKGDIRIDGEVNGNIKTDSRLVIGPSGKVYGEISCENLEISGLVEGKVEVKNHFGLKSTSQIKGDVKVGKISIEPGAIFHGSCSMNNQSKEKIAKS